MTAELEYLTHSVADTEQFGARLGRLLRPHHVVALHGDLGAGKTALTRGVVHGWGSPDRVTSPTFTLVNQYERPRGDTLYHLDCYRLGSSDEAETIGLGDILDRADGPVIIEWAARVADWLPADHLTIRLAHREEDDNGRCLHLTAHGRETAHLLRQLTDETDNV